MPNHTYQLLTVYGDSDVIEQMKEFARLDDKDLAHEKFFPLPEKLKHSSSPVKIMTEEEIKKQWIDFHNLPENSKLKAFGFPIGVGITQEDSDALIAEFGHNNWYDWAIENYGTKWGIYEQGEWTEENTIYFQSAWSPANLIICKLSSIFPQLCFILEACDEGGDFVCRFAINGGEQTEYEEYEFDSEEGVSVRKAVGMWGDEDEAEYYEEEVEN